MATPDAVTPVSHISPESDTGAGKLELPGDEAAGGAEEDAAAAATGAGSTAATGAGAGSTPTVAGRSVTPPAAVKKALKAVTQSDAAGYAWQARVGSECACFSQEIVRRR